MHVAFQIADGLLARREIAERDVHVGIDQPRNGRRAAGVDHDVAGFDFARRRGADRDDAVALGDDGVALGERFIEIAGDDRADIDDSDAHGFSAGMRARPRSNYCFAPLTVASRLKLASSRSTRSPASPHP